ncbi:hypothetical protein PHMEG_0004126 [Phytophthora megakarya]|uniref:DUSP domain-containing protein n=1 Tax=Phytophthora megakarya TaxID=4795 RepID=A0A225WUP0_9STRA|nr:hypothetical protein PHMEG_0004126 [Phytophthora megakarya]
MKALISAIKQKSPRRKNYRLHKSPASTPTGKVTQMSGGLYNPSRIIVAGMDITTWTVVEVNVPAGPLGILLDGSYTDAALLEDFAPVTREGAPGTIEARGNVPPGSVLVGMDKLDFMEEPRKNLEEIGVVLREAGHLERQLRFRVPPQNYEKSEPEAQNPQDDVKSKLVFGPTSSSASLTENNDDTERTVCSSESPAKKTKPSLQLIREQTVMQGPQVKSSGGSPSFVQVTETEIRPNHFDKRPFVASPSDKVVTVEVPPGSLGLNLDGSIANRAVVSGFVPLPDGSRGALERNGRVCSGAEIVEINGEDVSNESLAGIRERLGRLSNEPRHLSFRLPPRIKLTIQPVPATSTTPVSSPGSSISPSRRISAFAVKRLSMLHLPTYSEDMGLRRSLELKLVMSFDRKDLKYKECWFAVHTEWMNRWVNFVAKGGPEPGPITNHELLEPGFAVGNDPNRVVFVRPGLEITKDFRFVTAMVWSVLAALHGDGDAPPIARFILDIYSEAPEDINAVLHDAKAQASGLTTSLREKCQVENK